MLCSDGCQEPVGSGISAVARSAAVPIESYSLSSCLRRGGCPQGHGPPRRSLLCSLRRCQDGKAGERLVGGSSQRAQEEGSWRQGDADILRERDVGRQGAMGGVGDAFCTAYRAFLWPQRGNATAEGAGDAGEGADVAGAEDRVGAPRAPPQSQNQRPHRHLLPLRNQGSVTAGGGAGLAGEGCLGAQGAGPAVTYQGSSVT
mmetsp:Transcript_66210/g.137968  ORF Transcript_66210/g.137968 Transcript_66210/m.137968 type:complete len:202 (+) Transcript_66210:286-891(+)